MDKRFLAVGIVDDEELFVTTKKGVPGYKNIPSSEAGSIRPLSKIVDIVYDNNSRRYVQVRQSKKGSKPELNLNYQEGFINMTAFLENKRLQYSFILWPKHKSNKTYGQFMNYLQDICNEFSNYLTLANIICTTAFMWRTQSLIDLFYEKDFLEREFNRFLEGKGIEVVDTRIFLRKHIEYVIRAELEQDFTYADVFNWICESSIVSWNYIDYNFFKSTFEDLTKPVAVKSGGKYASTIIYNLKDSDSPSINLDPSKDFISYNEFVEQEGVLYYHNGESVLLDNLVSFYEKGRYLGLQHAQTVYYKEDLKILKEICNEFPDTQITIDPKEGFCFVNGEYCRTLKGNRSSKCLLKFIEQNIQAEINCSNKEGIKCLGNGMLKAKTQQCRELVKKGILKIIRFEKFKSNSYTRIFQNSKSPAPPLQLRDYTAGYSTAADYTADNICAVGNVTCSGIEESLEKAKVPYKIMRSKYGTTIMKHYKDEDLREFLSPVLSRLKEMEEETKENLSKKLFDKSADTSILRPFDVLLKDLPIIDMWYVAYNITHMGDTQARRELEREGLFDEEDGITHYYWLVTKVFVKYYCNLRYGRLLEKNPEIMNMLVLLIKNRLLEHYVPGFFGDIISMRPDRTELDCAYTNGVLNVTGWNSADWEALKISDNIVPNWVNRIEEYCIEKELEATKEQESHVKTSPLNKKGQDHAPTRLNLWRAIKSLFKSGLGYTGPVPDIIDI